MTDVTSVCTFPPIREHMTVADLQCEVKGEVAFFFAPAYFIDLLWQQHTYNDSAPLLFEETINGIISEIKL